MYRIFKWFTEDNAEAKVDWFVESFTLDCFKGEDKMLYQFLKYCSVLGIPAKEKYLNAFLRTESKKEIKANDIRLSDMNNFNYDEPAALEEATRVINDVVMTTYQKYLDEDLTDRNFKVDMHTFMQERCSEKLTELMTEAFTDMNSGKPASEVAEEMAWNIQITRQSFSTQKLSKLDFMEGTDYDRNARDTMRHLFNTNLPCVDGDVGGTFSKQLIALDGGPGSGKTRLACIHFAYQCMVNAKKDVLFSELELSELEIRNILVAYHIVQMFRGNIKIPDSVINKGNLTEEQARYVEAARIDLFESGKYGKIHICTDELVVETLEDTIYPILRRNRNIQYWIIDYAGLARSRPVSKYDSNLRGYEIIRELYITVKDILKTADIGGLITNQFNKEGVQASEAGKNISSGDVEGGMIIARHADYEIAITATKEQALARLMMMSTVKVRAAAGFLNVPFECDKSVSIFRQKKQSAVA